MRSARLLVIDPNGFPESLYLELDMPVDWLLRFTERAILPSALHHIARLNVEVERVGQVFNFQLPDIAGLVNRDTLLLQCFVERNEAAAVQSIAAAQKENAEVFVGERAGDGKVFCIHPPILHTT